MWFAILDRILHQRRRAIRGRVSLTLRWPERSLALLHWPARGTQPISFNVKCSAMKATVHSESSSNAAFGDTYLLRRGSTVEREVEEGLRRTRSPHKEETNVAAVANPTWYSDIRF